MKAKVKFLHFFCGKKVFYGIMTEIFHSLVAQNFFNGCVVNVNYSLTSLKAMLARFLCPLNVICKNSKIGRYNEAVGKEKFIFDYRKLRNRSRPLLEAALK